MIHFPPSFPEIQTKRLHLKEVRHTDAKDLHEFLSDGEVRKYIGIPPYTKMEETYKEIEWYDKIFNTKTGIRWGIALKDDPTIIGSCGFLNISQSNFRAEIGYELHRSYWRQGIVSEALEAVIKYGFEEMKLNRSEALIEPENVASVKLVERLGFLQEGLLREYEYGAGKFDDLYMYSLLLKDYEAAL
ncbi:N-acetyltransferase [Siminovitchia acidinfaciens]|uniref:N-acetyltransferase n=1 Tax=Siminovitchia acidinfaciens TaxID=2321395 RepID=A0A429Y7C6_9BACI|nr:GNAT family N-acetyltransferase [Siminovitchia acidinfaciens]RST77214.1 N-acetyltransferase [Siminovitchia acidinfaciens]